MQPSSHWSRGRDRATAYTDGAVTLLSEHPSRCLCIHAISTGLRSQSALDLFERSWGANANITLTRKRQVIRRGESPTVDVSEFPTIDIPRRRSRHSKKESRVEAWKERRDFEEFRISGKARPDFYEAHNELGIAYKEAGRTDDAENEFLRAHSSTITMPIRL